LGLMRSNLYEQCLLRGRTCLFFRTHTI
jgi:hypothetical protein